MPIRIADIEIPDTTLVAEATELVRLVSAVPMGRVATLGEVVGSVLYLLSPAAGYTTGQALRLDCGAGLTQGGFYR